MSASLSGPASPADRPMTALASPMSTCHSGTTGDEEGEGDEEEAASAMGTAPPAGAAVAADALPRVAAAAAAAAWPSSCAKAASMMGRRSHAKAPSCPEMSLPAPWQAEGRSGERGSDSAWGRKEGLIDSSGGGSHLAHVVVRVLQQARAEADDEGVRQLLAPQAAQRAIAERQRGALERQSEEGAAAGSGDRGRRGVGSAAA